MNAPVKRFRRLRRTPWLRVLVEEHRLSASDLIWPLFVAEGKGASDIPGLPGVQRLGIDRLAAAAKEAQALGIPAIALFPVVPKEKKSARAEEAYRKDNLVARAIAAVKKAAPGLGIIGDVALDPYTPHGHDGVLDKSGEVDNDATVALLCRQAVALADAGCDIVAPSDMMDGRVAAIRAALDEAGHTNVVILSYAAKYASAFYGPFRAAVGSQQGKPLDKRTYQMNPANADEALREVAQDVAEGADMVMVKPGLLYLDVLARVKQACEVPVLAYHVSGEYAMLRAAAAAGMLDERAATLETLLAFKRAGADAILTYAARDAARWLKP
ncbi:MAG: porphobilinogen synthase [Alphaproteobacteria bacterium]